jgi:hypothetical protein
MKYKLTIPILILILFANSALAGDIERGTCSVGVSSNAFFQYSRTTDNKNDVDDNRYYELALDMGYFILTNFELGSGLGYYKSDGEAYGSTGYWVAPYLAYHLPLNDKLNGLFRLGAGYGRYEADSNLWQDTDKLIYGETGLEYFLSSNVALGLSARWLKIFTDSNESWDLEVETLNTQLKFKLYF